MNRAVAAFLLSVVLCSGVATETYLYATNTLENNGHWISSKTFLRRGVVGAISAIITRPLLSQNRLNLGAWHGSQELLYNRRLDPSAIEFDFVVPMGSSFTLLFNKDEAGFNGLRISRSELYPPAFLSGSPEGRFLEKRPFEMPTLSDGGWSHARVDLVGNQATLSIKGSVGRFAFDPKPMSYVGFRGSNHDTFIANFRVRLRGSEETIEDRFSNTRSFWRIFSGGCLALLAMALLLHACVPARKNRLGICTYGFFVIAFVTGSYHALDWIWMSKLYPGTIAFGRYRENVEYSETINPGIQIRYPFEENQKKTRVLFLGSSQTWGAGARNLEDGMVRRIERMLNQAVSPAGVREPKYQCVNGAFSGANSTQMLASLETEWAKLGAALVVVNLSSNDATNPGFEKNISKIAQLDQSRGVRTLFVLEPNEREAMLEGLSKNHLIMRGVAERYGIQWLDLQSFLDSNHDTGFLWWDNVHLSSFGQKLAADFLFPVILKATREGPTSKSG